MLRIINFTRQTGATFLRASIREQERHGLVTQVSPPEFFFCIDDPSKSRISKNTDLILQHPDEPLFLQNPVLLDNAKRDHHSQYEHKEVANAIEYGALLALAYHLSHDEFTVNSLINKTYIDRYISSIFSDYRCPVVLLREHKTAHAHPEVQLTVAYNQNGRRCLECIPNLSENLEDCHLDVFQRNAHHQSQSDSELFVCESLNETKIQQKDQTEFKLLNKDKQSESKGSSLPEKLHDSRLTPNSQETSDYSSQSDAELFLYDPLNKVEQELLQLEESVIPLELEAVSAINDLRLGGTKENLEIAAEKGSSTAQFYLAMAYEQGVHGVQKDVLRAGTLYRQAADKGHPEAMYNLAVDLLKEEPSSKEGMHLLQTSSRLGVMEAREAIKLIEGSVDNTDQAKQKTNVQFGERYYKRGLEWEEHGDFDDWVFALDMYKKALETGYKEAESRYKNLAERLHKYNSSRPKNTN